MMRRHRPLPEGLSVLKDDPTTDTTDLGTADPMGDRSYAVSLEQRADDSGTTSFIGGKVHLAAVVVGHTVKNLAER